MAKMYGILAGIGWAAFLIVMALLAWLPPKKPKDSKAATIAGTDERHA